MSTDDVPESSILGFGPRRAPATGAVRDGRDHDASWVVVPWPEIDMANAHLFGELLTDAVLTAARAGRPTVWLDLTPVEFIDSQAVRELLVAARRGAATSVALVLHGARPSVRRLLDLTGASSFVTIPVPAGA